MGGDATNAPGRLPLGAVEERLVDLASGQLGEPALITLSIAMTPTILAAVSAWLATRDKDVEVSFSVEAPGISGLFSLNARTADNLTKEITDRGIVVPPT
jgi:hypothetical protein